MSNENDQLPQNVKHPVAGRIASPVAGRIASPPGVCISWEEAKQRYGEIQGDEEQIKRIWQANDAEAYDYLMQCLLSF